ncbi:MAG: nickel-dependent lactate racemase [Deltaproteobacteria bacterium]|nr:nickel-dependent lactate racemase [Deltaproteobacteria bacterium]
MAATAWKRVLVPFGKTDLAVRVPPQTETLAMDSTAPLPEIRAAVERNLNQPIGTPALDKIIAGKGSPNRMKVALVVSDITRPVPYRGESGILIPLLTYLEACGVPRSGIRIIVATGMHRPSTAEERLQMMGPEIVRAYAIEDHDGENPLGLRLVGRTQAGTPVSINRTFLDADLKICTGLVESHFMAGFSGGRKSVCPGLVDRSTLQRFHGPLFLDNAKAENLVLKGNPCHEEALQIAGMAGVDFILNVTVNEKYETTGVYGGDMVEAHLKACEQVRRAVSIPIDHPFDIILTHGGYAGLNHYQTAKAACAALDALKKGGTLIIAGCHGDQDPVGSDEYATLLHLLKLQGPDRYVEILKSPTWQFTKDQWEPQMWGKVLRKVGEGGIIYCCPQIPEGDFCRIPGRSGYDFLKGRRQETSEGLTRSMLRNALKSVHGEFVKRRGAEPTVAFLRDGPYGIPVRRRSA